MLAAIVTASLQHIRKTLNVRVDIGARILQGVADPGLGGEVNHDRTRVLLEQGFRRRTVRQIELCEDEAWILLEDIEARFLQPRIIIVVDAVNAHDLASLSQQLLRDMESEEAVASGDQQPVVRHLISASEAP